MNIRLLEQSEISSWRENIEKILEDSKSIWQDFTTSEDMIDALENGYAQFWMIRDREECRFAFMTQIVDDAVQIFWGYGELSTEIEHLGNECTQNLALMYGARRVEVHGRKGFLEKFKKWGFTFQKMVISKPVEHHRMN